MGKQKLIELIDNIHKNIKDKRWKEYVELEELGTQIKVPIEKYEKKSK